VVHGCFVLGLPGETKATMEKTVKFALDLNIDTVQFSAAMPFPGTEYYKICEENELIKARSWEDWLDEGEQVNHVASCNAMYKRDVIEEVGGFDERLWPGEDVDLDYKVTHKGYKTAYNPKAIIAHHRPKNLKSFFNMMKRYGWAQAYLIRKYGIFRKLHYVPFTGFLVRWGGV
jgi:GT2 family glycosyltransferase